MGGESASLFREAAENHAFLLPFKQKGGKPVCVSINP